MKKELRYLRRLRSLGRRDNPPHRDNRDDEQHNERQDSYAYTASSTAERVPHFLIQVEVTGRRFTNHGAIAQPSQAKAMSFVQIVKAHRA
jgi:hypothetical protein